MGDGFRGGARVLAAGTALGLGLGKAAAGALASPPEADLRGEVALVTGGSRGLGLALGRELVRQGCRLAICARDETELARARADLERIPEAAGNVLAIPCDVTDRAQVAAMVERILAEEGRIDILVNNAGIMVVAPLETLTHADVERVLATDLWGTLNPTLAVLPGMRARGAGRIVNITSIGGKIAVPHMLPYTVAKFAAAGLSAGLRAELAGAGIAVTTVVPGLMRTGSHLHAEFGGDRQAEYRWFALGASAPYPIAIDAGRAARIIVRAVKRGQAECAFPLATMLVGRLSGVFPGATAQALAIVDRLLPDPPSHPAGTAPGSAVAAASESPLLHAATTLGRAAAADYNQRPPQPEPA